MPKQFTPFEGVFKSASERRTVYANSVMRLFKAEFSPTASSTATDFEANECDFDNYAAVTLTAWDDPILSPGAGAMIGSPLVQFEVGNTDPVVGNSVGGFWIEDAAGVVRLVGIFDDPVPMQVAHAGLPINTYDVFPTLF